MSLPMSYVISSSRSGARYEIRWRRLTECLAMSASLAGVIAFAFWGA
jgi:hypothetical protein